MSALTVSIEPGFRSQWVGPGVEYLEDSSASLAPDVVRQRNDWQTFGSHELNFGFSDSVFWLRFNINNLSNTPQQLLLDNQFPLIDRMDFYIWNGDTPMLHRKIGDAQPAFARELLHSHLLVPLDLPAYTEVSILIRVQTATGLQLPIKIWEKDAFLEKDHVLSIMLGVLYGLLIALCAYHLIIFVSVRELGFLYFALINLSLLGVYVSIHGVSAAYIWPSSMRANDVLILVSMSGVMLFASLFINTIMEIPAARPRLGKLMYVLAGIATLAMVASLVLPHKLMAKPVLLFVAVYIPIVGYAQIRRVLDGYLTAKYILAGGVIAASGLTVSTLANTGVIAGTPITDSAAYVGIVLMSLMDAFALSYRMSMDRQLRLEAQSDLLNTQRQLNADLDRRVQERTEELEAANVRLLELSTTDGLTGLKNRRCFNDVFDLEFKRACREQIPLSLLLLDIDHFKQINDRYGHPFGDLCLAQSAQLIMDSIRRPPDTSARYGGEEFAVLLPNTDKDGAFYVANAIRKKICQHRVDDGQQQVAMTVSIGLASLIPSQQNTASGLLKTADDMLYQAKHKGRNRVEG